MKRFHKNRLTALLLTSVLLLGALAGCGSGPSGASAPPASGGDGVKVAIVMPGSINDMSFNASAYEGLKEAEERYGVETSYTENVGASDMEQFIRGYADQGYALIIGHGFEFTDPINKVAKEYPDIKFAISSGTDEVALEANVCSINTNNVQEGYLQGVAAALVTQTNKVGFIGTSEIPSIVDARRGCREGVAFVNPDIEMVEVLTGSFDDMQKAKESTLSLIDQGADVIINFASSTSAAVLEAVKERDVQAIGTITDQNSAAPDNIPVSVIKDAGMMVTILCRDVVEGSFESTFKPIGLAEGAIALSPWYGDIPQETKDAMQDVVDKLNSGALNPQ